ncbi:hypothetical protein [Acaryochloris sp. CCMEE 5410]|uniref:hypothetical protein n=1 Tax=Acaryochloris sp. CCMEE 5410 TaxID=310037 RepID=UPI0002485033|nr:hypothetical protein [Acaryochloris sp. CCMEE 5410]KAI9130099.1 hypothetical protein ON05_031200 [Acaryochloris sp. CCMEE 5410]
MRHFLTVPILLGLILLPLTACSSTSDSTAADAETEHSADDGHDHSKDEETHSANDGHDHSKGEETHSADDGHEHSEHELHSKGGQVVESDPYHIELVTKPKDDGTQLNLYLLHEAEERVITDAQVTANVQQPDGEQQTVKLVYEPAEEGYTGLLTAQATGQYDLVVQTDIGGEKINSRFSIEK